MHKLEVAIALYMVVSWRIKHVMRLGRKCLDLDASLAVELEEWMVAYTLSEKSATTKITDGERGCVTHCRSGRISEEKA